MSTNRQLAGKVAVVTGGTRGIGLAIAEALLARGASVAVSGRTGKHIDEARQRLAAVSGAGARVEAVAADVRDAAQVGRFVEAVVSRFGGLDVLVNNAGVGLFAEIADMSADDWRLVIETNLNGVFYACRAAIPHLRARGGGWIFNISSLAGKNPFKGGGAYCASKSALNAFSEVLMQEIRHDDIRVSYIMPGSVDTEFGGPTARRADWKIGAEDIARVIVDLMAHPPRTLASRIEIRPSKPPR
jgi:NAD(P)-dependent dehydrogenase (short-subunit alcohol dehydrogenase family)